MPLASPVLLGRLFRLATNQENDFLIHYSHLPWMGRRPSMPDSLPIIGPAPRHENLWLAFGHSHMGLTTGPMTGELIAEFLSGQPHRASAEPY